MNMDIKQTTSIFAFIVVSVVGAEFFLTLFCWLLGVMFAIGFYRQHLSGNNTIGFFVMIFASLCPIANDLTINFVLGSKWIFVNKLQYLITPFVIYTIYAAGQHFAHSYYERTTE